MTEASVPESGEVQFQAARARGEFVHPCGVAPVCDFIGADEKRMCGEPAWCKVRP